MRRIYHRDRDRATAKYPECIRRLRSFVYDWVRASKHYEFRCFWNFVSVVVRWVCPCRVEVKTQLNHSVVIMLCWVRVVAVWLSCGCLCRLLSARGLLLLPQCSIVRIEISFRLFFALVWMSVCVCLAMSRTFRPPVEIERREFHNIIVYNYTIHSTHIQIKRYSEY